MSQAEIGVFGGSGFYSFLEDVEEVEVDTPYGKPSANLFIGEIGSKRVAFLPRHGRDHELPPHRIPYRANVWAMRELGVRRIIGPNASGALKADLQLGEFVVCDQFIDRTSGRADTFYDGPETTQAARWALMHDAPEILLGDAPSPLKRLSMMEPYRRAEERVLVALADRFGLELPVPDEVHRLDRRALKSEVDAWLPHAHEVVKGLRPLAADFTAAWTFGRARKEYLAAARELGLV